VEPSYICRCYLKIGGKEDISLFANCFSCRVHKNKEQDYVDPISYDCMSLVEDWVMEKEVCFDDYGSSDWMSLNSPTTNTMPPGALVDDDTDDLCAGNSFPLDFEK
jgi:hypothetical protein